ncbi:MAG: hypothetical protein DMF85_09340, partial [Acidobacteria bacterium]
VDQPPFAELPLDVGGFPFTLDIRGMFLVQPAFTGALEATHGHFKTRYHGDLGFRVDNGTTTRIGKIEDDGEITDDVTSSSPYVPMGFVAATAFPRNRWANTIASSRPSRRASLRRPPQADSRHRGRRPHLRRSTPAIRMRWARPPITTAFRAGARCGDSTASAATSIRAST